MDVVLEPHTMLSSVAYGLGQLNALQSCQTVKKFTLLGLLLAPPPIEKKKNKSSTPPRQSYGDLH